MSVDQDHRSTPPFLTKPFCLRTMFQFVTGESVEIFVAQQRRNNIA